MRESRGDKERVQDRRERLRVGDGRERKCERVSMVGMNSILLQYGVNSVGIKFTFFFGRLEV